MSFVVAVLILFHIIFILFVLMLCCERSRVGMHKMACFASWTRSNRLDHAGNM